MQSRELMHQASQMTHHHVYFALSWVETFQNALSRVGGNSHLALEMTQIWWRFMNFLLKLKIFNLHGRCDTMRLWQLALATANCDTSCEFSVRAKMFELAGKTRYHAFAAIYMGDANDANSVTSPEFSAQVTIFQFARTMWYHVCGNTHQTTQTAQTGWHIKLIFRLCWNFWTCLEDTTLRICGNTYRAMHMMQMTWIRWRVMQIFARVFNSQILNFSTCKKDAISCICGNLRQALEMMRNGWCSSWNFFKIQYRVCGNSHWASQMMQIGDISYEF